LRVKLFRIRNWKNKSLSVYMSQTQKGANSFVAKHSSAKTGWRSIFFFDRRTKTIRVWRRSNFVLGNQLGSGITKGRDASFRKFIGKAQADQVISRNGRYIQAFKFCLTPHGWVPKSEGVLTWWDC